MKAKRHQSFYGPIDFLVPSLTRSLYVAEADYLAACKVVVELAKIVQGNVEYRTAKASLVKNPDYQRAQALLEQYTHEVPS